MLIIKFLNIHVLFFFLIFAASCHSQNQRPKDNSTDQNLATKNKLLPYGEHDKVTSAVLDKVGDLWFGTSNEGVYRYDGASFVNFKKRDGLPSNYINCIVGGKDGTMWFGTKEGLGKYDGTSFSLVPIPSSAVDPSREDYWWDPKSIQSMLEDRNGNLWIGTCGYGAYRYDGESFTNFSFTNDQKQVDGLHHNFIQSMMEDTDGNIWFTSLTHGAVSRYDGEHITHFGPSDGLKDDMVYSSFQDKAGNLWFGSIQTKYSGLYRYDGKTFTSFGKEDGLCDNFVTGFFEDRNGKLWIRTGSILCIYDEKTFAPFVTKEGEELRGINFIVEDKEQNIWLGGQYGHLWKYNGKTFVDFTNKGH